MNFFIRTIPHCHREAELRLGETWTVDCLPCGFHGDVTQLLAGTSVTDSGDLRARPAWGHSSRGICSVYPHPACKPVCFWLADWLLPGLLNKYLRNGSARRRRTAADKGETQPPAITAPLCSSAPQSLTRFCLRAVFPPLFLSCLTPLRWKEQAYHGN